MFEVVAQVPVAIAAGQADGGVDFGPGQRVVDADGGVVAVLFDQAGAQLRQTVVQVQAVGGQHRLERGGERTQSAQAVVHAGRGQGVVPVQAGGACGRRQLLDRRLAVLAITQRRAASPGAQGGQDLRVVGALLGAVFALGPHVLAAEQGQGARGVAQGLVLAGELGVEGAPQVFLPIGDGQGGQHRADALVHRQFGQRPAAAALGPGLGQLRVFLRRQRVAGEGLQVVALHVSGQLAHCAGRLAGRAGQVVGRWPAPAGDDQGGHQQEQQSGGRDTGQPGGAAR